MPTKSRCPRTILAISPLTPCWRSCTSSRQSSALFLKPSMSGFWVAKRKSKPTYTRYSKMVVRPLLEAQLKGQIDPRCISIWNSKEGHEGSSIQFVGRPPDKLSVVQFFGRPKSFSSDWQAIASVIETCVRIWSPQYITIESNGYYDHRPFKDRPGVGWMLYLPRILTVQQVPEARAL